MGAVAVKKKPAVFLDRDGVICEFVEELSSMDQFRLRSGVGEAIRKLNEAGFYVFVTTNQPNIAKGKMTQESLEAIHLHMEDEIAKEGGKIDRVYYCPHRLGGKIPEFSIPCDCRKPQAGMLRRAVQEFPVDVESSFMVGDTWRDLVCAWSFGIPGCAVAGGGGFPYQTQEPLRDDEEAEKYLSSLKKSSLTEFYFPSVVYADLLSAVESQLRFLSVGKKS